MLENADRYLFRWDKVPGNNKDTKRLAEYIKSVSGADWIDKDLKLVKGNDRKITISKGLHSNIPSNNHTEDISKNDIPSFFIELDDNYENPTIIIGNHEIYLTAEKRGGKIFIYSPQIPLETRLGDIKAIYRNLRENYEFKLRYDEAGKFFIREMELKRKYREGPSISDAELKIIAFLNKLTKDSTPLPNVTLKLKRNNWFRRNLFSLTGWYYHLSRYGEDLLRPTLAGMAIVFLSTLFWLMQSDPTLEPSLDTIECNPTIISDATRNMTSKFIGLCQGGNHTHWLKALERGIADFIPLLPPGSDIKIGILDYAIKIVGGAITFGTILIALRRRFERKYTR
jgi:hypothetical protein